MPVTSASAFGRVLTRHRHDHRSATRDIIAVRRRNRLVDRTDPDIIADIAADPTVKNIVDGYNTLVSPLANQVIGTITAALPNTANAAGEMPAGDLIADAQLQATQPASLGGAVIAFMNAGGVRNPGFAPAGAAPIPYDLTYGDAFTVQPFGNSLVTMTLTAQQIKNLLEQQFAGCMGQIDRAHHADVERPQVLVERGAAACSKIVDVDVHRDRRDGDPPVVTGATEHIVVGGVVQNPAKTYRVTVNNFMATGGDGFRVLLGGTNSLGGAQDIDALSRT